MGENLDDSVSDSFTKMGLQHLIDRAHLRHSIAEIEGDEEEMSMSFGEVLAFCQLALCYGWDVVEGQIQGEEDA